MRKLILALVIVAASARAEAGLLPFLLNLPATSSSGAAGAGTKPNAVASLVPSVTDSSADTVTSSAGASAVITYAAVNGRHCLSGLAWSYSAAPTGGSVIIEDVSGTVVFRQAITAAGPGFINFPVAKRAAAVNTAMIITLAAPGGGVVGVINAINHWVEYP